MFATMLANMDFKTSVLIQAFRICFFFDISKRLLHGHGLTIIILANVLKFINLFGDYFTVLFVDYLNLYVNMQVTVPAQAYLNW